MAARPETITAKLKSGLTVIRSAPRGE